MIQNVKLHSLKRDLILFDKIPVSTIELPTRQCQTFPDIFLHGKLIGKPRDSKVNRPSRSTGVNPSRQQKYYSPSCLWSQAQWDTYGPDYSQSLNYIWINYKWITQNFKWPLMYLYVKLNSSFIRCIHRSSGLWFVFKLKRVTISRIKNKILRKIAFLFKTFDGKKMSEPIHSPTRTKTSTAQSICHIRHRKIQRHFNMSLLRGEITILWNQRVFCRVIPVGHISTSVS